MLPRPTKYRRVRPTLLPGLLFILLVGILALHIRLLHLGAGGAEHRDMLTALVTLTVFALAVSAITIFYFISLLNSETRYHTLFDSIDEGFCIVEVIFDDAGKAIDYRFLETNQAFERQTELTNVVGRTMREFAPEHEPYWFEIYGRIALTGEPARFQNRADELGRWYDVYAFQFGRPGDHQVAILFKDIKLQKQSEEALRESEERFRAIYERAPLGIEQVALDGKLQMVNSAQCAMLGYEESELLSKTFEDITHPNDQPNEAVLLQRLFSGEQQSYSLEKRYLHKNGSPVWVSITSTLVRSQSGSAAYRITVVEDISVRKQAERAIIQAEKLAATGRMASTMAHEINNPLSSALNSLYLVSLDKNLSPPTAEYITMARRELQRVAHMTQQTLGLHREMGAASSVDLRKIADSVLNLYGPKLENKDIRVETRYFATAPVFAVEAEVRQILANLISNSIDALPHKGCIHLRIAAPSMLDEDRPAVRITIADNGSGIDPQHLKQVFEPFFSTKETTGTGLGLWVAQELVRKHDGKIKARSTPGQGTVFQIFLPIERRSPLRLSEDRRDLNAKAS